MKTSTRKLKNNATRAIALYRRRVDFKTCKHCNRSMCPVCYSIGPSDEDKARIKLIGEMTKDYGEVEDILLD